MTFGVLPKVTQKATEKTQDPKKSLLSHFGVKKSLFKRSQNSAPVLVIISGNSLVFSRKIITSTGFYRCCAPGASAPVVVKNQSPTNGPFRTQLQALQVKSSAGPPFCRVGDGFESNMFGHWCEPISMRTFRAMERGPPQCKPLEEFTST